MTKQTIEVEVPKGWKAVAYRRPMAGEYYLHNGQAKYCESLHSSEWIVIQKNHPRRIVLEETDEERSVSYGEWLEYEDGLIGQWSDEKYGSNVSYKVWREVKETEEPKLSLSVIQLKDMRSNASYIMAKVDKFIKENS